MAPPAPETFSRSIEVQPEDALARVEDEKVELLAPVLFARDRDLLLPQSRAVLDAAAAVLRKHSEISKVRVEGHTDSHGRPQYNLSLSDRRARAVRAYLVKKGIAPDRLDAQGFGSARPIDANDTAEGRARNRRVEMVILDRATKE